MHDLDDGRWPLSGAQSGIWFAQQLDPDNPIFNTGEYIDIRGPVDPDRFETAVRQAVMEAEALHARFGRIRTVLGRRSSRHPIGRCIGSMSAARRIRMQRQKP